MNIYEDWKLICDAYPAIASTCQNGTDIPQNAKRLFMITTSEQRSDPNADLEAFLLGPPGLTPKPMEMLYLRKAGQQMLLLLFDREIVKNTR